MSDLFRSKNRSLDVFEPCEYLRIGAEPTQHQIACIAEAMERFGGDVLSVLTKAGMYFYGAPCLNCLAYGYEFENRWPGMCPSCAGRMEPREWTKLRVKRDNWLRKNKTGRATLAVYETQVAAYLEDQAAKKLAQERAAAAASEAEAAHESEDDILAPRRPPSFGRRYPSLPLNEGNLINYDDLWADNDLQGPPTPAMEQTRTIFHYVCDACQPYPSNWDSILCNDVNSIINSGQEEDPYRVEDAIDRVAPNRRATVDMSVPIPDDEPSQAPTLTVPQVANEEPPTTAPETSPFVQSYPPPADASDASAAAVVSDPQPPDQTPSEQEITIEASPAPAEGAPDTPSSPPVVPANQAPQSRGWWFWG